MQIITHPHMLEHRVAEGHPERPDRLRHVSAHLAACGLGQDHPMVAANPASPALLQTAHTAPYLEWLSAQVPTGEDLSRLDPDTWMGAQSLPAALLAVGAVCQAVDDAVAGREARSFCLVRPPGHHAESDAAMGFCMLNSIAIGAHLALQNPNIQRIAILDFDVHHGNGTVDIFRDNPAVLVCSSFQHPFYPHRFFNDDWSNIINTPLPSGSDGRAFRLAIESQWLPAVQAHQPDIVFVSAGFDAHQDDPLAGLNLTEADFTWITEFIVDIANTYAKGRIVSALEGGYELGALARSVEAHLVALA